MGKKAVELFWQLCERRFPELVDACGEPDKLPAIHEAINLLALQSYDAYCPKETARQIDAWAECQKDLKKFIRELMEADRRVGGVPSEF